MIFERNISLRYNIIIRGGTMKICPLCHTENEEDAIYCKKCAHPFYEDSNDNSVNKKDRHKVKKQTKVKTKTKYKTKVQKQKLPKEKQKSGFFSKFLVFVLLILVIGLAFVLGLFIYHYYEENNIKVPNVVGYSYDEAVSILTNAKLSYQQKTVFTKEEDEVDVVIKQSKRAGSKTHENAVITLTVGILDTRGEVPDVRGLTLEEAVESLNSLNISYQVVYQEDDGEENIVLKQNIRSGKVIDNTESITLTVSQKEKILPDEEDTSEDDTNITNDNTNNKTDSSVNNAEKSE